jgi:hypothetical protein
LFQNNVWRWVGLNPPEVYESQKATIMEPCSWEMAGHMAGMEKKRNVYRLLVGKPEGKRPLGRPRRRWIDNIKMGLFRDRIECCGLDWSGSG